MHTAHVRVEDETSYLIVVGGRASDLTDPANPKQAFSSNLFALNLSTLEWTTEATWESSPMCSHCSVLLEDRYLIIYGGFNGLSLSDHIVRYDFETKELLTYTGKSPFK